MAVYIKLLYLVIDFVFPLMLGYYLQRKEWLSEAWCKKIIVANLTVFGTFLSILSFWVLPLQPELLWLPLFGFLVSLTPGLAGYLIVNKKYAAGTEKASYLAAAMLSNIGALASLCAFILLGERGFAYTQIVALFQNLIFFLFCFPMAQYYRQLDRALGEDSPRATFSSLFFTRNQLPVAGMAIGMALYLGNVPRPESLGNLFTYLIHVSAWLAMIPVGYSLNFAGMRSCYAGIVDLIPIKFILTPLIAYIAARCVFSDQIVVSSILIAASVPTGANTVVLARLYDLNLHIASAAFFMTTVIFLSVVYPILFFWLNTAL
jgi:predicted permease